ncbi:MAG: ORF6N domain-containing protein [Melioribacteraceae bacterium]
MAKSNKEIVVFNISDIKKKIYTVRNEQVMLDSDLAMLYNVETRRLNEQVKRNRDRFPFEFMFQLTAEELEILVSQNATPNRDSLRSQNAILETGRGKHRKYLPYAFTEQGVAMLSAVLKSETAVKMSIQIMSAFVAMRRFLVENAGVFQRLDKLELKQIATDQKVNQIFDALQSKDTEPRQGIFYDGQVFDAYKFVSGLIKKAEKTIILIDNYIHEMVLDLLTKKRKNVEVTILTKNISKALKLDEKKFNEQYGNLTIKQFKKAHDRFLIIDDETIYHFGASLKDLGKKWFAFQKFDKDTFSLLYNIKKVFV